MPDVEGRHAVVLGDNVVRALRNLNELGPTLEAMVEELRVLRDLIEEMRAMRDDLGDVRGALRDTTERLDRANELAEEALRRSDVQA